MPLPADLLQLFARTHNLYLEGIVADEITTAEVADISGLDIRTIQKMIGDGRLPARRLGQIWVVCRKDAEKAASLVGQAGRPKKKVE